MEIAGAIQALGGIFARSPVLVIAATPDGRVLFSNRGGADVAEIFAAPSRVDLASLLARVAASRTAESLEATSADPAARTIYMLNVAPIVDGDRVSALLCVGLDITERKTREERMRRSEALLVDTQGVAHLGTWEWDVTQPLAEWSDELYRIYGETHETYTPTYEGYLKKVHPDDRAHVMAATEAAFSDRKPYSHDERIFRPDGSIRYLHTWGHAICDDHGKLLKLIGVCQDITDRKQAEEALAGARKHEAIGRLAAGIAHDFNNVLGVILGNVSAMQAELPERDPSQASLEEVVTATGQGARLTQQLLAFSRGQTVGSETLDLGRIVVGLGDFLRRAVGKHIDLRVRVDETVFIQANRSQIEQVVMNLVVNARDAMPEGGLLAVEVAGARDLRALPNELDPSKDYAMLSVTDSGEGMPESVRGRAFDPYFSTKAGGHGLGLATVEGIAKQARGTVSVASAVGQGTTFRVYLPRVSAAAPAKEAHAFSGTILLVDDHDIVRRSIGSLLQDIGFTVLEAGDPHEALHLAESTKEPIDLCITDCVMPRMSGTEVARRVRALRKETKIVLMTGLVDEASHAPDASVPVLRKPFTTAELEAVLRRVLGTAA
jgi:PAS domain S-box-containing protein